MVGQENKSENSLKILLKTHGDGEQIKYVVENTKAQLLIPIHTVHDEYHKKWHKNVTTINQHEKYNLK